ncbi:NAD kinase [Sanguibacter suaedae]|uniref:NAD kinase n=1 Tax=Sanguibacter suaedae TaxID=2795737 RepID=A0A934IE07_9MICO|nr:NAD kinase [Sanguibacter suaedae]MBI9116273.1 NAD kinase [Sanguibacter suaedae]
MSRKILVVTHGGRHEAVVGLREAVPELRSAGFEVLLDDHALADDLGTPTFELDHARSSLRGTELVMVLGGDGTILRAAEITHGTPVPLLGVNLGHVGFLAESEREDLREAVRRVAAHDYVVEERGVLDVTVHRPGTDEPVRDWALNEATIEKNERTRMIEVAIEVDGRPLSSFGCDGVVMATATGSTAHAFSAGGPVMWPDVDAKLLVPLSAHALFARPLVVGPRSQFAVEVATRSGAEGVLITDGRRRTELPVGSRVEVRTGAVPLRFARLNQAPFTDRLVSKFSLPVVGWRGALDRPDVDTGKR